MNRKSLLPLLVLAALCAPLYLVGSTGTGFRGTDELRYAQISKELGPGADLFLLRFNGVRYSDKPPLYFWLVDVSNKALGEFSPHGLRRWHMLHGYVHDVQFPAAHQTPRIGQYDFREYLRPG